MSFNPIVPPFLPALIRDPASYPGQQGVPGADVDVGFRMLPSSRTLYVDNTHGRTNDDNDGTDAENPLETIQGAVDKITTPGDTVIVQAGEYEENVVTGAWNVTPNYCNIIGAGPHRYRPYWDSGSDTLPALDLRTQGWRISGFRFGGKAQAASIQLRHFDSGAADTSIRTIIDNCYFDGLQVGRYGIEMHGSYDVWIYNNSFAFWNNAVAGGAIAIRTGSTPTALPYRVRIYDNEFYENNNHIYCGLNGSFIVNNLFVTNAIGYDPTIVLRTIDGSSGGNSNLVTRNYFGGDYSIAGGYVSAATDEWGGNTSMDTAEAEVDSSGLTIGIPT